MLTRAIQYTCVLTCLIGTLPCHAETAADRSTNIPAESTAVTTTVDPDVPEALDRSRSILSKVRETNEQIYGNLRSFVCNEEIQRYRGSLGQGKQIDTVTTKISFENGTEHYSDIRQNAKTRPAMSSLGGAWSEGEFGTLLQQTQLLLSTSKPVFHSYAEVNGIAAAIYEMEVTTGESPWDLEVRSQHSRVPFRTRVWVSQTEGEILKIERVSTSIPMQIGISEIRWNVVLKEVELNGRMWLLPDTGEYAVLYDDSSHREWNVMQFSNYHHYGSEVAIRFQ